jgi:hypothetical protein
MMCVGGTTAHIAKGPDMSNFTPATTADTDDYLRRASLRELAEALKDQQTRALDVVVQADQMRMRDGALVLQGVEPQIGPDGVTDPNGLYRPTRVGYDGLAGVLDIPGRYVRRLSEENVPLLDDNVNGWYGHESMKGKAHLYRLLTNPAGDPTSDGYDGICRAVLSDRYRTIDNFDVLMAALSGMQAGGVERPVIQADLTEKRMVVRVTAPGIARLAPVLLKDYRSPWGGAPALPGWTPDQVARAAGSEGMGFKPGTEPIIFAGFQITNSETGHGAFRITPVLEVMVCRNGLTVKADATKEIHLGGRLESGLIDWSEETRQANITLITAQTKDVVQKFLSPVYVDAKVAEMEKVAGVEIAASKAPEVIRDVAKSLRWSQSYQDNILDFFMEGGQLSAGGVMQAVTAFAQTLPGDDAYDVEGQAMEVLKLAAAAGGRR